MGPLADIKGFTAGSISLQGHSSWPAMAFACTVIQVSNANESCQPWGQNQSKTMCVILLLEDPCDVQGRGLKKGAPPPGKGGGRWGLSAYWKTPRAPGSDADLRISSANQPWAAVGAVGYSRLSVLGTVRCRKKYRDLEAASTMNLGGPFEGGLAVDAGAGWKPGSICPALFTRTRPAIDSSDQQHGSHKQRAIVLLPLTLLPVTLTILTSAELARTWHPMLSLARTGKVQAYIILAADSCNGEFASRSI